MQNRRIGLLWGGDIDKSEESKIAKIGGGE